MSDTASSPARPKPVILCVLDGWGHREICEDNAICQAKTPNWDRFLKTCPNAFLDASELEVGLPTGQMGNSEVGHMNLGAGRVVLQDLPRIDSDIASGALAENPRLSAFIAALRESGGTAHLMGLLSPGGVHSHQAHIAELARILTGAGVPVAIHAFLDGRDMPPRSAREYLAAFIEQTKGLPGLTVATVSGRYYAMDRDNRWDRNALAWAALVEGSGETASDAIGAVDQSYAADVSDEFVKPTVIDDYAGMADGDGLLMANFRADRARQILAALLDPAFDAFARARTVRFAAALGMVEYSETHNRWMDAVYPSEQLSNVLGAVVAGAGLTQLRIAETEKYAHVTFFLNGGVEAEFPGEERILIPSPKVATYDLQPEMSAPEVTDRLVEAIGSGRFDLIVVNYANTDMVGHTGDLDAARQAVETVDTCLGRIAEAAEAAGGCLFVTADHGNAELMRDAATGQPHTAHTSNVVPAVLINPPAGITALADGRLADVAPTLLAMMGLPQPAEMTGTNLASGQSSGEKERDHRLSA